MILIDAVLIFEGGRGDGFWRGLLCRPLWRQASGKKGALLLGRLVESCSCTLRRASQGRKEEVGAGRFLGNEKVSEEEILAASAAQLGDRVCGLHVLAIQDTSEVNYQHHAGRVRGLGPVGNGRDLGLFVHPVIAVEASSGALLGLAGAQIWTRPAQSSGQDYRSLPIEEKESYRWLCGGEQAKAALGQAAMVTVIADRESDIYEEWARLPDERCHLITRASRNRALEDGGRLFSVAEDWPVAHRFTLDLRAQPGRSARCAKLELRFGELIIKRPQRCSDPDAPASLRLNLVEVREVAAEVKEPIHWRLLTTHAVESVAQALQIVEWYRWRWHIEQLFRTLKSQGLDIEASQVTSAAALKKLVALASIAAVRIMQLVLARDGAGGRPASDVLEAELLPLASALQRQLEGKTEAQKNPHEPASLPWLAWIIARLGGWKGYKSERKPGPITMSNGWKRFEAIADGWRLSHDVCMP